jgi:radical SAM superfamily enzyme YgiQ (UPF0313 family)
MSIKVLFVYPNYRGMNMLPPAIGLMSAILKNNGHTVRLFDTTYYENIDGSNIDSDASKTERLMARPFNMPKEKVTLMTTDVYEDFEKEVNSFQPELLALSATEDMFPLGIKLLKRVQEYNILTIAGGVFATFAPELVLSYPEVDIVCRGEGEETIRLLCERLSKGKHYNDLPNLFIKNKDGSIRRNPLQMIDMDNNPLIDMSLFEEARYYRPMGGKVWRMFPVETHRGCPFKCNYCNSPVQRSMYKEETGNSFLRRKSFQNIRKELLYYKNVMKAEYLYFWADTFFSWTSREFDEFCEIYEDIRLPFWCQTRPETVEIKKFKKLKDIGCARIAFGLEHGNEEFRRKKLNRRVSNKVIIENLRIVNNVGIPFSVNNIIGFPSETYELAMDTIKLNRQIESSDRNAYAFTPFHGTPLRQECERLGYIEYKDIVKSVVTKGSILDMPQFPKKKVDGLIKVFNMYCNFPESKWTEVKIAEEDTSEGHKKYDELKREYIDQFWSKKTELANT